MTIEEELISLREENTVLRDQLAQRDELIQQQQALLSEQNALIQRHNEQMSHVSEQHVERCEACQHDLHAVAACGGERRQVVDLPSPRLVVREYRAEQKQCPHCQQITMAAFPAGVQAPLQYGAIVGATAVYLVEQQLLPLARACEVMSDLLGVQMSEGTVCDLIARCAGRLAPVEQQIKAALTQAEVIHQDETGLYVEGLRHWMHVTCTPTLTHYHVATSRGQAALEAIGILPHFTGISIHDGWSSYFLYDCQHAACIVQRLARSGVSGRRTGSGVGR